MSVKSHLMDDEELLDYCMTDKWAWAATDQRLLKYRQSNRGGETLSDLSYDEISGVNLQNEPRDSRYLLLGVTIGLLGGMSGDPGLFVLALLIAAIPIWVWRNSAKSYFEFRGSGLLQNESEMWRIQNTAEDDATKFVKAVRSRL